MIIKMSKIRIYGPKDLLDSVTNTLYEMGVLHVEQLPTSVTAVAAVREKMAEDKEFIREKVELESLTDKLTKALVLLPRPEGLEQNMDAWFLTKDLQYEEITRVVNELYKKIESLFAKEKELNDQIGLLKKYEKVIKTLAPLVENTPETKHLEMIGVTIDRKSEEILGLIEAELSKITGGNFHVFKSELDKDTTAAVLAFGKTFAPRIKELLWEKNLNEIRLPSELEDLPLHEALKNISYQSQKLPEDLKKTQEEIGFLASRWYFFLADLKESVNGKLQQIGASSSFFKTRYSFVIGGYIPTKSLPKLKGTLYKDYAGKVILEQETITEEEKENIPVHMVNPPLIKPFEVFVKLLPAPIYGTIDPTPFFAFFFPLFFGLILGDAGYGIVIFLFSLFMMKKLQKGSTMHDIFTVLTYSSIYCIVFGLMFAEVFGTLGEHYLHMHPIHVGPLELNRITGIQTFLAISVVVGAIHVFLGIALGIVNSILTRHKKHLIFKIGQFASLLGLIVLIAILAGALNKGFMWPTVIILIAGLVAVTFVEGFIAPIEILSAMGNILSYARIMAIGLASVIMALVANKLGAMPKNIFVGIIIAGLLHFINIILGIFSPTIHSMRLHLVEFFGKFYETGGREYKPFKKHGGE